MFSKFGCNVFKVRIIKYGKGPLSFFGIVRLFSKIFQCLQRVPLPFFECFATEWMLKIQKSPFFYFFSTMRLFKILHFLLILGFLNICPQTIFNTIRNFDVISGVKRSIRIFDVMSGQYCALLWRRRRFENMNFPWKHPTTYILKTALFEP